MKRLILISGPVSSGKTTLARALADRFGAKQIRTRMLIVAATKSTDDRADLQAAGEKLDSQDGGKWLASAIAREVEGFEDDDEVVIDSVRIAGQVDAIRSEFGARVFHVHITGREEDLAARYEERKRKGNAKRELPSYAQVRQNSTELKVDELAKIADVVVDTDRCTEADVLVRVASHLGYYGRGTQRLVDVLVGGQWGSEGKGHIASYLAPEYSALVRVGGPNAGHKVYKQDDQIHSFYHLPSGTLHAPEAALVLGPGAVIYPPKLLQEISDAKVTADRLSIDPQAMIIEDADREFEAKTLKKTIASTGQGVGVATARKVMRGAYPGGPPVRLARDLDELKPYVRATRPILEALFGLG